MIVYFVEVSMNVFSSIQTKSRTTFYQIENVWKLKHVSKDIPKIANIRWETTGDVSEKMIVSTYIFQEEEKTEYKNW